MACKYYDDALVIKLNKWLPDNSNLRVLKPSETKRLFELIANDANDEAFKLPFIALSRNNEIELLSNVKSHKSFDGLKVAIGDNQSIKSVAQLNVIPIKLDYQLDIYTKTVDEGDEYLRSLLFKLINNPAIKIDIPYNDINIQHIANIRVGSTVTDSSDITERIFSGQFTRWTIQLEIQDAFLFSVPYKKTWKFYFDDGDPESLLELSEKISLDGVKEPMDIKIKKD